MCGKFGIGLKKTLVLFLLLLVVLSPSVYSEVILTDEQDKALTQHLESLEKELSSAKEKLNTQKNELIQAKNELNEVKKELTEAQNSLKESKERIGPSSVVSLYNEEADSVEPAASPQAVTCLPSNWSSIV